MRVPPSLGLVFAGERSVVPVSELPTASNPKAKRGPGWLPTHASWHQGLAA
jgi:hypothetical protein